MKKRQENILQILSEKGAISVQDLAQKLNVSRMTIYRDIEVLLKTNYIKKVSGGIAKRNYKQIDPGWQAKSFLQKSAKQQICEFVSKNHIKDGQSLFIESGSTALTLIPFLTAFQNLKIYTNCIAALSLFDTREISGIELHMTAGILDPDSQALIGSETLSFIKTIDHFDSCFLSATGISLTGQLQDPHKDIIAVKQAVIKKSDNVFFLLDHSKFGKQSQYNGYDLNDINYIISDKAVPEPFQKLFLKKNIMVLDALDML